MTKAFNIQKAINKVAKTTNLNEARTGGGGGDYQPPAKGVPGIRFVAYVETGAHKSTYKGKDKITHRCELVFELHGKRWPLSENGQPQRLSVRMTMPKPGEKPHTKSTYYKTFKAMNYDGTANHFAQLLGNDYVATVFHRAAKDDDKKFYAQFNDPNIEQSPFTIRAPFVEDEDGEPRRRKVPEAINPLRLFLWEHPDADQWSSIFIEGEYDDGKSKNKWQDAIKSSLEFEGSPIEALLMGVTDDDDDEDDVESAKAEAKVRTRKNKPAPEPEDDDEDDYDGTNDVKDDPAFDPDEDDKPASKGVKGNTTRAKNATAKRGEVKKQEPADSDDDGDDPLSDIGDE